MPKLNTTVKSVRIDNDKLAELEERLGSQSINSWLNEQILTYLDEKTSENKNMEKEVNPDIPAWRGDLNSMLGLGGMSFDEFMEIIYGWVCDGTIDLTDGVGLKEPGWVTDFRETCHDLCIPVDKAVESACKALRKGEI